MGGPRATCGVVSVSFESAHTVQSFLDERDIDYVFVGPRPNFKANPRTLIAKHGTLEGLNAEMMSHINIPEELDFNLTDRHYFSAIEAFCEIEKDCVWQINGRLAYRDTHHIFPVGSEYFGKKFADWYENRPEKRSK